MALPKDALPIRTVIPTARLTDPATGMITTPWRALFMALLARTGDMQGVDIHSVQGALVEADNALAAVDVQLSAAIDAETNARRLADTTEQSARTIGDAVLNAAKVNRTGDTMTGPLTGPLGTFGVVQTGGAAGPEWIADAGPPGTLVAPLGSLYSNTTGTVGATLYVSRGGGVWNPVTGV
jgi:hypothetical protein